MCTYSSTYLTGEYVFDGQPTEGDLGRPPTAYGVAVELAQRDDRTLRKLKLRRGPLIVWYSFDPGEERLVFVRLFHARQDTPRPGPLLR